MDEVLTIEEIRARYDSEWILLLDPEVNENMEILGGRVACHSADRDEVYEMGVVLGDARTATSFTGKMPNGMAVVL